MFHQLNKQQGAYFHTPTDAEMPFGQYNPAD